MRHPRGAAAESQAEARTRDALCNSRTPIDDHRCRTLCTNLVKPPSIGHSCAARLARLPREDARHENVRRQVFRGHRLKRSLQIYPATEETSREALKTLHAHLLTQAVQVVTTALQLRLHDKLVRRYERSSHSIALRHQPSALLLRRTADYSHGGATRDSQQHHQQWQHQATRGPSPLRARPPRLPATGSAP